MLDDMGISYENIDIEKENINREDLEKITGAYTVPQIIINNKQIVENNNKYSWRN